MARLPAGLLDLLTTAGCDNRFTLLISLRLIRTTLLFTILSLSFYYILSLCRGEDGVPWREVAAPERRSIRDILLKELCHYRG